MARHVLGILASGGGSNFQAIADAVWDGRIPDTRIGMVVSDKEDAGALEIARQLRLPHRYLGEATNDERNERIAQVFKGVGVELGIGAGYLKRIGGAALTACPEGYLNIHPAPLYRFGGKGMHGEAVHQAVIDSGEKWSGPTIHFMDEEYDQGQILAHRQVPVLPGDTAAELAARILPVEHDLYWRVIAEVLTSRDQAQTL